MWVFTDDGFYSVAKDSYCSKDTVMVRARVKDDLERLFDVIYKKQSKRPRIKTIDHSDYRFRAEIVQQYWAAYLYEKGNTIDYPTVKDNIIPERNHKRSKYYYQIWNSLCQLQDAFKRKG